MKNCFSLILPVRGQVGKVCLQQWTVLFDPNTSNYVVWIPLLFFPSGAGRGVQRWIPTRQISNISLSLWRVWRGIHWQIGIGKQMWIWTGLNTLKLLFQNTQSGCVWDLTTERSDILKLSGFKDPPMTETSETLWRFPGLAVGCFPFTSQNTAFYITL